MIIGIGTDLCQVQRMSQLLDDGSFLRRYFEQAEQAYILARGACAAQSMAGHFAAKEAFVKALGAGLMASARRTLSSRTSPAAPHTMTCAQARLTRRGRLARTARI